MRNNRKKARLTMRFGLICILLSAVVCAGIKREEAEREEQQKEAAQLVKQREEQEQQKLQAQIEEVLSQEPYQTELRAMYAQYPQMENIFLNREQYPDWLIEYLVSHEEAVDWVIDYPEYMAKTEEERLELAHENIPEEEDSQYNIPMLFQWDRRWGYVTYGSGPIAIEGCGPTCLSMVAVGFTGDRSITPEVVAEYAMENGYYVEESGTSWSLMLKGAKAFGLTSEQVKTWSANSIKSILKSGKVIICSVGEGDFTQQGHFIVIVGLNKDGTVSVNDPNNRENCEKTWDISTILNQAKGLWEIGI